MTEIVTAISIVTLKVKNYSNRDSSDSDIDSDSYSSDSDSDSNSDSEGSCKSKGKVDVIKKIQLDATKKEGGFVQVLEDLVDIFDKKQSFRNRNDSEKKLLEDHTSVQGRNDLIRKFAAKSPQNDPEEFLQQLELHERLHRAYESETLSKTCLSMYLKITSTERQQYLQWLGSNLVEPRSLDISDLPRLPLRLNKIPGDVDGCGDKGFYASHNDYPNCNAVHTPDLMSNLPVYQYHENAVGSKRGLCKLRWTSESANTRIIQPDASKDVIEYRNFAIQPFVVEWGHALVNLGNPCRKPGRDSGIPDDYFDAWD